MADDQNPDSPTNFTEIGKQIAAGLDAIGFIEKLATSLANGSVDAARKTRAYGIKALVWIVSAVAGALFELIGELDPAFGALAATVVGNMFEIPVNSAAFGNMKESGGRKEIATAVGASLLAAFKGDQANAGAGELEPSTTAAESYLGVMANLAIEGWVFEVIGSLVPELELESLGDLKDSMARVLGLGRLSRTVFRPFVSTLIAQPAQWAVNKQYRPKMLSVSEAIDAVNRGDLDEATLLEISARDGFGDDALAILRAGAIKPLSVADAQLLVDAGELPAGAVVDELRRAGHDADRAQLLEQLRRVQSLHKFELEMVTAAGDAYAARKIDEPQLLDLLSASTIDTTTLNRIHELASQRRLVNVQHLTRGDVERAVKLQTLSVSDYSDWLHARGYANDDALTLELNLQAELQQLADAKHLKAVTAAARAAARAAKDQAAVAKRDQVAGEHAHWSGTLGQAERLVVRAIMPALLYRQILIDHLVSPGDADELVSVATQDRDARQALIAKRAAARTTSTPPAVPLATVIHAILLGARSIDVLAPTMQAAGYSAADVALEEDVVRQELADRAAAAAARAARAPAGTAKALTLAQLERAVLNGVGTIDQYRAALIAAGFGPTDTTLLVADLNARLEQRRFADTRRALAEEKLAASHLVLATEEKAVVDGLQTIDDYRLYLAAHGFDADDQAILVALLELKLPAV